MRQFSKISLLIILVTISGYGFYSFRQLEVSENLNNTIPGQEILNSWIEQNKKSIVFSIPISDHLSDQQRLIELTNNLINDIQSTTDSSIVNLSYQDSTEPQTYLSYFYEHIYLYLTDQDYVKIDSMIQASSINEKLTVTKEKLNSPEGIGMSQMITKDPLNFMGLALKNIQTKNHNVKKLANNGLFISNNGQSLFLQGELNYDFADSELNDQVAKQLGYLHAKWLYEEKIDVAYFGTFLIANANAVQIKNDIMVTVSLAIFFIISLLIYYYRRLEILLFFLLPGFFGVLFAIGIIYLTKGHISGLALGASSIIFGIVADYSFHFFSQFMQSKSAIQTRNEIWIPLLISASTTIIAFLSLFFSDSNTLQDFGYFTSLSLIGTLFFVLVALPLILKPFEKKFNFDRISRLDRWLDQVDISDEKSNGTFLIFIGIATAVLLYFSLDIKFENDLSKLNYYPENLKKSELALQNIDPNSEKRINIVVKEHTLNRAISDNSQLADLLTRLEDQNSIKEFNSLSLFLKSNEEQASKIAAWEDFWNVRRTATGANFRKAAVSQGFNPIAFSSFYDLIYQKAAPQDLSPFITANETLRKLILRDSTGYSVLTSLICEKSREKEIKQQLGALPGVRIIDNESIVSVLIEAVRTDFNIILLCASLAVFITLLITYGSFEMTLVTFIPMVLSWIWILGISVILDIKFNFINIILATFIFGLGDDFSIFITDGLLKKYKSGKKVLGHYKTGILLSSVSTIVGTGVLIFAKHPAIKSIAAISVIGICTIVFISFFVQPLLFRFFITSRTEINKAPKTIFRIVMSVFGFSFFVIGSILSMVFTLLMKILPFIPIEKRQHWVHLFLQGVSKIQFIILINLKERNFGLENLDFDKPSILIANHGSFLDILALLRLHPKVVLVVNDWVYYSPLFGLTIRFADFLPTRHGHENNLEKIKSLIDSGHSIAIFPEGRRSENGEIGRFHKGAFYLSTELKIDITPILFHGYQHVLPKNDFVIKFGLTDVTVLPRIKWNDGSFGQTYQERTKSIAKYFGTVYKQTLQLERNTDHFFEPLLSQYKYKGPVLEWYFRIKWKFEKKNYEALNQMIGYGPKKIYDLGCGYGYLSYFLLLRDSSRKIIGVDYDEEKIEVANHSISKNENISFFAEDISNVVLENADVVILADVLHYLNKEDQLTVLQHCDEQLQKGGVLAIRDGMADNNEQHEWTKKSEKWSTELIKFNKTSGPLHFFTQEHIENWAKTNHFAIKTTIKSDKSSNTLIVLIKE